MCSYLFHSPLLASEHKGITQLNSFRCLILCFSSFGFLLILFRFGNFCHCFSNFFLLSFLFRDCLNTFPVFVTPLLIRRVNAVDLLQSFVSLMFNILVFSFFCFVFLVFCHFFFMLFLRVCLNTFNVRYSIIDQT